MRPPARAALYAIINVCGGAWLGFSMHGYGGSRVAGWTALMAVSAALYDYLRFRMDRP